MISLNFVMPGVMPGIHVFATPAQGTWMAGTKPGHDETELFCRGWKEAETCQRAAPARSGWAILAASPPRGGRRDRRLIAGAVGPESNDPNCRRLRVPVRRLCRAFVRSLVSRQASASRQDSVAARESLAALQGITEPAQITAALRQHPSSRVLQMLAMAMKAADDTSAAAEKLAAEVEQPPIPRDVNLGAMNREQLEAFRRNLKTAGANASAFMPRYTALLKTERDGIEKGALALHVETEMIGKLMETVDKRQAEMTTFTSKMMAARAEFYRAYESYVAVIAGAFGTYKVVDGQFIFPLQGTVDRYNVAATAMTAATKRVVALDEERRSLLASQQAAWVQFANGK